MFKPLYLTVFILSLSACISAPTVETIEKEDHVSEVSNYASFLDIDFENTFPAIIWVLPWTGPLEGFSRTARIVLISSTRPKEGLANIDVVVEFDDGSYADGRFYSDFSIALVDDYGSKTINYLSQEYANGEELVLQRYDYSHIQDAETFLKLAREHGLNSWSDN